MKTKPVYRGEAVDVLYQMALDLEENAPFDWLLPLTSAAKKALEAGDLETAFNIYEEIEQEAYKHSVPGLGQ